MGRDEDRSRRVHAWPRPYIYSECMDVMYIKLGTSIIPAGAGLINNYRLGAYYGTSKKKIKHQAVRQTGLILFTERTWKL